ncbi:MAG: hypothetical protein WC519_00020 [Parcubacteria group bacterium]
MKESTKRLIVLLGSLVFVAGALYVFAKLISPKFSEIQTLRGQRQSISALLADYETAIQEKNRVLARYENVSALRSVFSEVVPPTEDVPSFMNQLYGLAKLNEVTVDSIEFQELSLQTTSAGSLAKPYGTVQATIKCASKYENMKAYLSAIETNIRLMDVTSINITEGFDNDPILVYTMTVSAYYLAE